MKVTAVLPWLLWLQWDACAGFPQMPLLLYYSVFPLPSASGPEGSRMAWPFRLSSFGSISSGHMEALFPLSNSKLLDASNFALFLFLVGCSFQVTLLVLEGWWSVPLPQQMLMGNGIPNSHFCGWWDVLPMEPLLRTVLSSSSQRRGKSPASFPSQSTLTPPKTSLRLPSLSLLLWVGGEVTVVLAVWSPLTFWRRVGLLVYS